MVSDSQEQYLSRVVADFKARGIEDYKIEAFKSYWLAGKTTKAWHIIRHPTCGAKRKKGGRCISRTIFSSGRCKYHGGLSTGPKTPEGRAKIAEAQRERWRRFRHPREMEKILEVIERLLRIYR